MNDRLDRLSRLAVAAKSDGRYRLEAYLFVIEALNYELEKLGLVSAERRRHLTARELLEGIKDLGWERYGRLSRDVFESWGALSGRDFGEVVFKLIEVGEFTKTAEDRIEDFDEVLDFERDLVKAYPMGKADKN